MSAIAMELGIIKKNDSLMFFKENVKKKSPNLAKNLEDKKKNMNSHIHF